MFEVIRVLVKEVMWGDMWILGASRRTNRKRKWKMKWKLGLNSGHRV